MAHDGTRASQADRGRVGGLSRNYACEAAAIARPRVPPTVASIFESLVFGRAELEVLRCMACATASDTEHLATPITVDARVVWPDLMSPSLTHGAAQPHLTCPGLADAGLTRPGRTWPGLTQPCLM